GHSLFHTPGLQDLRDLLAIRLAVINTQPPRPFPEPRGVSPVPEEAPAEGEFKQPVQSPALALDFPQIPREFVVQLLRPLAQRLIQALAVSEFPGLLRLGRRLPAEPVQVRQRGRRPSLVAQPGGPRELVFERAAVLLLPPRLILPRPGPKPARGEE